MGKGGSATSGIVINGTQSIDEMIAGYERELVLQALHQNSGSLTRTAEQLKITRHALRYRMQRLNIQDGNDIVDEASATKADNPSE